MLLCWLQTTLAAGLGGVLICLFCLTWKPSEEGSSPASPQRSIHAIDAFYEELMQREAAIPDQAEGDDAAGGMVMTSASHEYREQSKRAGGNVAAGTTAAAVMSLAATPVVRRLQQEEGGYVRKGGPAAKLASHEAHAKSRCVRRAPSRSIGFEL